MQISEFAKECFNKYVPHIYLLVFEDENINIYEQPYESLIISQSLNINYQMIKVLEIINRDNETTFKIQLPDNKKAYFTPKSSVLLLPKKNRQVRISDSSNLKNELNLHLHIDQKFLQENRSKVFFSQHYAIFNNKIYECLVMVDEIIGFVEQENINELHRYEQTFKIINDTTTYKDSSMTNATTVLKNKNKSFKSQYVIPREDKIRLKQNGKNVWIDRKNTDLDIDVSDEIFCNLNELFIGSTLFQYHQKLESYHKYYSKLVNQNR